MTLNTLELKNLLTALPALKKIYNAGTLLDYFQKEISDFLLQTNKQTPDTSILLETIYEEVTRLYDKNIAKDVVEQLTYLPIMETGTHLAFLRDYDSPKKDETRSLLNQNILISGALMKKAGAKYHIGFYGSNVSLIHPCGGGYYQLGDTLFPVSNNNKIRKNILYQTDRISNEYFNETVLISAKLNLLDKTLDTILKQKDCPHKEKYEVAKKIVTHLTAANDLKTLQTSYASLKQGKKQLIEETLKELNGVTKKISGLSFDDVDEEYQSLKAVFERDDLKTLSDQTAIYQTATLNRIFKNTGILHLTVDGTDISRKFLIKALQDENSLWSKIFSNPQTFNQFQKALSGIRAAWKEDESPFIGTIKEKGLTKSFPVKLEKLSHDKETLIELLKSKQIAPSSAMTCLITQSANILAHGGFFQSTYAEKMKQAFQGFLTQINEQSLTKKLDHMPVDLMFLSLGVIAETKTKKPLKLSEISKLPSDRLAHIIQAIPHIGAAKSVLATAGILNTYLNETAPGYIEGEVLKNQSIQKETVATHRNYYHPEFNKFVHMHEGHC